MTSINSVSVQDLSNLLNFLDQYPIGNCKCLKHESVIDSGMASILHENGTVFIQMLEEDFYELRNYQN